MKRSATKQLLYTLTLTITLALWGCGSSGTTATPPADIVGELPIANAGVDITVEEGTTIVLDGSGSTDSDGTIVSYEWQTENGVGVSSPNPTLSLGTLAVGSYTATLLVTDNDGNTATDTVTITVIEKETVEEEKPTPPATSPAPPPANKAPVANAGVDQTIVEGSDLHLDGSASTDSDGTIAKYEWYKSTNPNATVLGKTATITGLTVGTYTITLKVTDNDGATATDSMSATVTSAPTPDCVDGVTVITHNGTTYSCVTSPHTGKIWLDRNLGASRVCTALDDTQCYGDYYQWGRNADGHEKSSSNTTATQATDINNAGTDFITSSNTYDYDWAQAADGSGSLRATNWSKTDGSSVCPAGYRVPTEAELKAETTDAGVANNTDAFNSFLKLPSAGYRNYSSGSLINQGSWGYVWSASVGGSDSRYLVFGSSDAGWNGDGRADGLSVRCLRD